MESNKEAEVRLQEASLRRVELEEAYRQKVREELRDGDPRAQQMKQRVWQLLNSAFGLFLMSSVLISGLSWGYTQWVEARNEQSELGERIRKLDLEIAYRLHYLDRLGDGKVDHNVVYDVDTVFNGEMEDWLPSPSFPEFEKRSVASLMWDLQSLLTEEDADSVKIASRAAFDIGVVLRDAVKASLEEKNETWYMDNTTTALLIELFSKCKQVKRWQY